MYVFHGSCETMRKRDGGSILSRISFEKLFFICSSIFRPNVNHMIHSKERSASVRFSNIFSTARTFDWMAIMLVAMLCGKKFGSFDLNVTRVTMRQCNGESILL